MDALILVGGMGTRLSSVVSDVPKSLAPILGRPFLSYLVDFLKASGVIERIILSSGYKADQIKAWADGQSKNFPIICIEEKEPLGTGGAILNIFDKVDVSNSVLVMNGDSFVELDIKKMIEAHIKTNFKITLAVTEVSDVGRYGEVLFENNRITSFREKSSKKNGGWVNAGIYLINPASLALVARGNCSFEQQLIPKFLSSGMGAYQTNGAFIDIGVPESYKDAARILRLSN